MSLEELLERPDAGFFEDDLIGEDGCRDIAFTPDFLRAVRARLTGRPEPDPYLDPEPTEPTEPTEL